VAFVAFVATMTRIKRERKKWTRISYSMKKDIQKVKRKVQRKYTREFKGDLCDIRKKDE